MTHPEVGEPISDSEILSLLRSLKGQDVAFILIVTSDLRIGTFPEYRPTEALPTLPDFLRWLADSAEPEEDTDCRECGVNGGAHRPTCIHAPSPPVV